MSSMPLSDLFTKITKDSLNEKIQSLATLQLEINDLKKQLDKAELDEKKFRRETDIDKNREKNLQALGNKISNVGKSEREVVIYIPTEVMTPILRDFLLSLCITCSNEWYGDNKWHTYNTNEAIVCRFYADESTKYKSRYLSKHCKFNILLPILKYNDIPYCYFSHTKWTGDNSIIYNDSFPFKKVPGSVYLNQHPDDDDYPVGGYDDGIMDEVELRFHFFGDCGCPIGCCICDDYC